MQLDLDPKQALHFDKAWRTMPGCKTERSAEGQPPCAFGLENLTHLHVSHVADRVLVLWLGVRPEPLRWETEFRTLDHQRTPGPM